MKKAISVIILIASIISVCTTFSLPVSAYPAAYSLPTLTGNQAQDTANIAKSQIGYSGASGTVYGAWWNGVTNWGVDYTCSGWCAMFACWCAYQAGAGLNIAYNKNGASPSLLLDWFKGNATYDTSFSSSPKAGDFIFFGSSSGYAGHVAIVTDYNSSTRVVSLVGGNQGSSSGGAVTSSSCTWRSGVTWGGQYVIGYGRPKYSNVPITPADDSLSLYSYNYPTSLDVGKVFSIYGTVSSGYSNITSLTVGVYNTSGTLETGKTVYPNSKTYNIANVDAYVLFNKLSAGTHYYRITATNASGTKQLLNKQFSVVGAPVVGVVRMVDCYRKVSLPARVVNLYWNPTDTSRASYFDYGPTIGCPTYAEMTDGSIMYKANVNHKGEDTQMWFKLESDMTVTKVHTYGSVQYEYDHPHRAYQTCACGQTTYTGNNGTRDNCSICHPATYTVSYNANGGSNAPASQTKTHDVPLTLSSQIPLRTGYRFLGWARSSSATTAEYSSGGTFNLNQSVVLYAVWQSAYSGTCGENLTWSYNEATKTLTISGSGEMDGWGLSPSVPWYSYRSAIKSVSLPNGLTSIGEEAFGCCSSLTSVTIPDSVTSIGAYAFGVCSSLTSVTIPDSVASIGDYAFRNCSSLTSITVAEENPSYSSDAYGVLFNKNKTELICCPGGYSGSYTIPDSVTSIREDAFYDCSSLTSVTIGNSVTSIGGWAFYGCSSLTSVTIGNSVTSIGNYAFYYCSSLTSVTIPDSVMSIGYDAFEACSSLTSVTIGNSVTSIGSYAFSVCRSLTSVTIPDSVTSIERSAFSGCSSLTSVTIGNSVTGIGNYVFDNCSSLTSVYFCGDAPELGVDVFVLWDLLKEEYIANPRLTLYYIEGKTGWTTPTWNGYPTATWKPEAHEHSYTETVTAPTCTQQGYTTHTCACGDSYIDSYTAALGHNFVNGVCSRCGEKDPNYVPPVKPDIEFTDVKTADWYYSAVNFAVTNNLFNGMGDNKFEPNTAMNRAMLVTVLWRYAGSPKEGTNTFTDVKTGQWYTDAVAWASSNSIVGGVGEGKFDPNGNVTREQLAAILYRYSSFKGIDTGKRGDLSAFPDKSKVSSWAGEAYAWAVGEGLIGGNQINGKTMLDPQGNATRAQVATILMRYIENVVK